MAYEHVWALLIILWILGLGALGVWREHLRRRHQERLREMVHRERMLALERQVPLPELLDLQDRTPAPEPGVELLGWRPRRPALGCGILALVLGGGIAASFGLSDLEELRAIWSLGLIPMLVGVGLLLVHFLERRS
jgi:hypothetical protein